MFQEIVVFQIISLISKTTSNTNAHDTK